jgi:hypothetical protein
MNRKEKAVVIGGSVLLAAILMIQFVIRPMADRMERDRRAVVEGERDLAKLRALGEEYLQLKAEMDGVREKIARHKGGAGALSILEGIEKECGFSHNVTMHSDPPALVGAYSQTKVTIQLEGVTADQAAGFLMKIQSADAPLGVRSLKLTAPPQTPAAPSGRSGPGFGAVAGGAPAVPTWNAVIEVVSAAPAGEPS